MKRRRTRRAREGYKVQTAGGDVRLDVQRKSGGFAVTGTIPPGEVVKNPTGTETTFVVLTVLGLLGLGGLIYAGTRKKTPPPAAIPGGGNTGVVDTGPPSGSGDVGGGGSLPPPPPPSPVISWTNALGPSGNYAYEPGGRYRISMPPQTGSSFVQLRNSIGQNGFTLVDAWDAGAPLPADWPASDRDASKWRFEIISSFAENKVAPTGWAVWRAA